MWAAMCESSEERLPTSVRAHTMPDVGQRPYMELEGFVGNLALINPLFLYVSLSDWGGLLGIVSC